jgi:hypothetical protein
MTDCSTLDMIRSTGWDVMRRNWMAKGANACGRLCS